MLVISRKKGESLLIGDNIEITVIKLDDGTVKLAIEAPRDVLILRSELYKEVENENQLSLAKNIDILKNINKK